MITFLLLLGSVASLILMAFVLASGKRQANIVFSGIIICFAVWYVSIAWFLSTPSAEEATIAARVYYIAAGSFAALLLYFALYYPENKKIKAWLSWVIFVAAVGINLCIIFFPNFIFSAVRVEGGINVVVDRASYLFYSLYFTIFFFIGISAALKKYRYYRGMLRAQSGLYAIGILMTSIPGFVGNLILPYYQNYNYVWVGPIASVFFLGMTGYSIIRHRMFDIKILVARTLTYLMIIAFLGSFYAIVLFAASTTIIKGYSLTIDFLVINTVIAIFFAISYPILRKYFDRITDRIFFRHEYRTQDVLDEVGDIVSRHIELESLMQHVLKLIDVTLRPMFVGIVLLDGKSSIQQQKWSHTVDDSLRPLDFIKTLPKNLPSVSIFDGQTDYTNLSKVASRQGVAVIMKLEVTRGILGYVVISDKKSGTVYSQKDANLLGVLADELSLAIQNSLRFQEIRDLNESLKGKVEAATLELRMSNKRLRAIDASKDEFISMASHQLRTPLTSIKGYISMLLEGDLGEIKPEQRKALEEAYTSSQRMVYLIGDFLNLSRLQTGRFELERTGVSLPMIIREEIAQLRATAQTRGIELSYEEPVEFPTASVDENKIRQVMMNFIDNAIYYAKSSGGTIVVSLMHHDHEVVFKVKDNGIGVPAHERPHLFTKFYRAANARKARPDGTGIGLYMAKKVIVAHDGSIIFESKEGEGSTFGFRLPLAGDEATAPDTKIPPINSGV